MERLWERWNRLPHLPRVTSAVSTDSDLRHNFPRGETWSYSCFDEQAKERLYAVWYTSLTTFPPTQRSNMNHGRWPRLVDRSAIAHTLFHSIGYMRTKGFHLVQRFHYGVFQIQQFPSKALPSMVLLAALWQLAKQPSDYLIYYMDILRGRAHTPTPNNDCFPFAWHDAEAWFQSVPKHQKPAVWFQKDLSEELETLDPIWLGFSIWYCVLQVAAIMLLGSSSWMCSLLIQSHINDLNVISGLQSSFWHTTSWPSWCFYISFHKVQREFRAHYCCLATMRCCLCPLQLQLQWVLKCSVLLLPITALKAGLRVLSSGSHYPL